MSDLRTLLSRLRRGLDAAAPSGLRSARVRVGIAPEAIDWLGIFSRAPSAAAASHAASHAAQERFYWSRASEGTTLLGLGAAHAIEVEGPGRFHAAAAAAAGLWSRLACFSDADAPPDRGPLLLGGFAFADGARADGSGAPAPRGGGDPWRGFPSARLVLPELLLVGREDGVWLTLSCAGDDVAPALERARLVLQGLQRSEALERRGRTSCGFERDGALGMAAGPEYRVCADRSHADYRAQVMAARAAIVEGRLEKVVLARSLRVRHDGRFDVKGLLRRLAALYPECVSFAVAREEACFLGATPELLVARSGRAIRSCALAGSAPRGRTPEEDARRARALRESKKEQAEHAVVVRAITEALAPACERLDVPESPRVLRLEGIQHLQTPIEGALRPSSSDASGRPCVIELAGRLHPTPAVGGAPRASALDWIEHCEGLDRGWYAGPLGFVDREGDGEMRVALRSALLRGDREGGADEARLFAGGGIVADSDPDRELEETRIKLRALLAPLTEI